MYRNILSIFIIFFFFTGFSSAQPSGEDISRSRKVFNRGVQYGIDKNYENALESFNKAIEINPIYTKAFLYRGLTRTELSDYEGAIKDFTITIELDPGYSDQAHYFRGLAKYGKGDYNEAAQDLTIAIRLNPDFISFFQRGKTYLMIGEYGRALQDLDISYRLNPDFDKTPLYRGKALYHVGQYEEAVKDLDSAKKIMPDNPSVYYYSGLARIGLQNSYAAIQDLNRCIELSPDNSNAYTARAKARQNTGNHDAAQVDLDIAKTLLAEAETAEKKKEPEIKKADEDMLDIAAFFSSDKRVAGKKPSSVKDIEEDLLSDKHIAEPEPEKEKYPTPATPDEKAIPDITKLSSGFYTKMLENIKPRGFGVQVASYVNTDNLQNLAGAYEEQFEKPVFINVSHINGQKIYRIIIGQFESRTSAESFRDQLRQTHFSDSFLVVFERLY